MLRKKHFYSGKLVPFLFLALALAFGAAGNLGRAVAATPPPAALQPYLTSGHFKPGNYAWMRGRFVDAGEGDVAVWGAIQAWLRKCKTDDQKAMQQQMRSAGIVNPQANDGPFDDFICDEVGIAIPHLAIDHMDAFQSILDDADVAVRSISWTVNAARQILLRDEATLQDKLRARVLIDQILRQAAITDSFGGAMLSKDQMAIVRSRIWLAIRKVDRENTVWLKEVVSRNGWVDADKYGVEASDAAWLLVQHADQDPLFQYHILRELDPTRSPGKVSRRQYALLTDRVMLKITGRQIYGSQLICEAGNWVPFPIENEAGVDARRAQMELGQMKQYVENFVRDVGKCAS